MPDCESRKSRRSHYVGIDLGPKRISAALFDPDLRWMEVSRRSTKAERGATSVIERIARCLDDVLDEANLDRHHLRAVGIGVPGSVDPSTGRVVKAVPLGWHDVPLARDLSHVLGVPVFADHDGQLATLAVHTVELQAAPKRLLGLFIGGRVGGGWMIDGRACAGFDRASADPAHWVLDPAGPACHCGHRGCFDSLASRRAVLESIQNAVRSGHQTTIAGSLASADTLRGKDLRRAFRTGDPIVTAAVQSAASWMGVALGSLVTTLRPDTVALGGSLMDLIGNPAFDELLDHARRQAGGVGWDGLQIHRSLLADKACATGAALLAHHRSAPPTPANVTIQ